MSKDDHLRRIRALHRKLKARLVKDCLQSADPDLREFAASLPAEVDSVEAHLKNFWQRKGLTGPKVQDFAVRFGRALAGCAPFQTFEREMEELSRLAGSDGFAARLAAAAARLGVDPGALD